MLTSPAFATLQDDYRALELQRMKLNQIDRGLIEKRKKLDRESRKLRLRWAECAGGRWHILWEPVSERLASARKELGLLRNEVTQVQRRLGSERRRLDNKRRSIETKYEGRKGRSYEQEFRSYMDELVDLYLGPFEDEYIYALSEYLATFEARNVSVRDTVDACENRDLTAVSIEQAVNRIDKVIGAISSLTKAIRGE